MGCGRSSMSDKKYYTKQEMCKHKFIKYDGISFWVHYKGKICVHCDLIKDIVESKSKKFSKTCD
jgi:hypothetical protein